MSSLHVYRVVLYEGFHCIHIHTYCTQLTEREREREAAAAKWTYLLSKKCSYRVCSVEAVETVCPDGASLLPLHCPIQHDIEAMGGEKALDQGEELLGQRGLEGTSPTTADAVVVEARHISTVCLHTHTHRMCSFKNSIMT